MKSKRQPKFVDKNPRTHDDKNTKVLNTKYK
jgi:hypothetical protein